MSMQTYNGWKNRATWALALWLGNEYEWYQRVLSVARGRDAAAAMEAFVRNEWASMPTLLRLDVGADMSEIDWQSVAEAFNDEHERCSCKSCTEQR